MFNCDRAVFRAGDDGYPNASAFKMPQRPHDGVVFETRCDDVIAWSDNTIESNVQCVRAVLGEDDTARISDIEETGHQFTRILQNASSRYRHSMAGPPRIAPRGSEVIVERCADRLRFGP
jgi:hypothetical protein